MRFPAKMIQELTDLVYIKAQKLDEEMIAITQHCYDDQFIDQKEKELFLDAMLEARDKFYSIGETLEDCVKNININIDQYI